MDESMKMTDVKSPTPPSRLPGGDGSPVALVVMAASLGGVEALSEILSGLPPDFPAPIAIVQHRTARLPNFLAEVLGYRSRLSVKNATEGESLLPGIVYIAPPDHHLFINPDATLSFRDGRRIRYVLSSANPLFESAAAAFPGRVIAVVLTGGGSDATDGVQSVKESGGIVLAQDASTAASYAMPRSAIATGDVDMVLPLEQIAPTLVRLVNERAMP